MKLFSLTRFYDYIMGWFSHPRNVKQESVIKIVTKSQILNHAADCCLLHERPKEVHVSKILDRAKDSKYYSEYSCLAIRKSAQELIEDELQCGNMIRQLEIDLIDLGVDVTSAMEFHSIRYAHQRQTTRYMWLKFAALLAEEGVI